MSPKAYLSRYQEIQHQIAANADEAIRLRSLAEKCTVSFDSDRSGGAGDGQRIPHLVEAILRLEAQTQQLTQQLEAVRLEILAVINAVPRFASCETAQFASGKREPRFASCETAQFASGKREPQQHHRELLRYRYLASMTFEEIADRMGYSYRQIIRLHGRSLQIVADIIAQDARDFDSSMV